jgi:hypothetical protein
VVTTVLAVVEVVSMVVVVLAMVLVVVVRQVPSSAGFDTLNKPSLFVIFPSSGPKRTLYESPPVSWSSTQPLSPGLGGTTDTSFGPGPPDAVPFLPFALNAMVKTPFLLFLIAACATAPFSPLESLYLNPEVALPVQKGFPLAFVPCGSAKVCSVDVAPSARTVRVAPSTVGSPTRVFELAFSLALPVTFRFTAEPGSLTTNSVPRIV